MSSSSSDNPTHFKYMYEDMRYMYLSVHCIHSLYRLHPLGSNHPTHLKYAAFIHSLRPLRGLRGCECGGVDAAKDDDAVELHRRFVAELVKAEAIMTTRNRQRGKNHGLPYKLLLPRSEWDERKGLTGQGIPYSISI